MFLWILFGGFIGLIANTIDPSPNRSGIINSIIWGILGAVLGGLFANVLFGVSTETFSFASFLIAIAGSLLALLVNVATKRA